MTRVFVGPLVEGPAEGIRSGVDGMETCSYIARKFDEVVKMATAKSKDGRRTILLGSVGDIT